MDRQMIDSYDRQIDKQRDRYDRQMDIWVYRGIYDSYIWIYIYIYIGVDMDKQIWMDIGEDMDRYYQIWGRYVWIDIGVEMERQIMDMGQIYRYGQIQR